MKTVMALAMVGAATAAAMANPTASVSTPAKDVKWQPLDPKDTAGKGPQVSVVFGDMTKKEPIGFFLKVPAGFKPGPHTHTSDDYAVIVQGSIHNFKPGKDEGPGVTVGGTWFQKGGEVHDNDCEKSSKDGCIIYVVMPNGFDFVPAADPAAKKK
jgi:hypothetical protein